MKKANKISEMTSEQMRAKLEALNQSHQKSYETRQARISLTDKILAELGVVIGSEHVQAFREGESVKSIFKKVIPKTIFIASPESPKEIAKKNPVPKAAAKLTPKKKVEKKADKSGPTTTTTKGDLEPDLFGATVK